MMMSEFAIAVGGSMCGGAVVKTMKDTTSQQFAPTLGMTVHAVMRVLKDTASRQTALTLGMIVCGAILIAGGVVTIEAGAFRERHERMRHEQLSQGCLASGKTLLEGSTTADCQDADGRLYANPEYAVMRRW